MAEQPRPSFRATYRLQLTPELGFREARALVPYLRDLGISHLYLSPSLQAREGSTHGYDVVDPRHVSPALGGEEEFRALAGAGLGVILDIVPNHMAATDDNPFWADLDLREMFFDIDLRTGFHRRFFDIGELGGLKQEDEEVFWGTHAKVIALVRQGVVDGVRVDHPDGLANPREYFERLRAVGIEHVWAEKIVESSEQVRDWPIEGTTGYEFLNEVMGLFVNGAAECAFTELYGELTGDTRAYEDIAALAKLELAVNTFEPELRRLHDELAIDGLAAALASFHVYRTYVEPATGRVDDADREEIARAGVPDALARILLLEERGHDEFVTRFQQTTGPVMAKGVEDTAFYRYFRLAALNEVGGNPARFGVSVDELHRANLERQARFPLGLLTTFTHDTKRSPDVRARIVALTWLADEWAERVRTWLELGGGLDDPREEYLVFQTLVGAWPLEPDPSFAVRLEGYLEKALREGKVNSSWTAPNLEHEALVKTFAAGLLDSVSFRVSFEPFVERVAELGRRSALAQLLLKLTSPGLPDVYQGDELEALALVDPDNRRPVDWELRRRVLDALRGGAAPTADTAKLYLTWKTLELRARHDAAFAGAYEPLDAGEGWIAFVRGGTVLVGARVDPRAAAWAPPEGWRDALGLDGLLLAER